MLPNIVVVQAESTFNVNDTFRLTTPVRNGLFEQNAATRALGSLYVNAVGGSSWRSEFESIVGIDERLFGYAGAYTHTSLSPFVKQTFVKYLKQRGYSSVAYYAVEGEFYNARSAYARYGFDQFLDSVDLSLPPGWTTTDDELAQAVVAQSAPSPGPTFQFVVTVQNHGPHWCDSTVPQRFVTRFMDAATFTENCVLNDFISRARSTDAAIGRLLKYLRGLERHTGRPYVLLVYGDHQPYTFTDPAFEVGHGYETHRKGDKRHTFFHLMSSIDGVVKCCRREALPLTAVPTMLSAYVANRLDDLYLPVNLFGYDRCGSDALAGVLADDWAEWTAAARARRCRDYEKVVAAYRAANVF
jgi:phosphoglycerol transferase MdoB-like AlkP superfamily enzyme